MIGLQPALV
jgi:hypothetical protein